MPHPIPPTPTRVDWCQEEERDQQGKTLMTRSPMMTCSSHPDHRDTEAPRPWTHRCLAHRTAAANDWDQTNPDQNPPLLFKGEHQWHQPVPRGLPDLLWGLPAVLYGTPVTDGSVRYLASQRTCSGLVGSIFGRSTGTYHLMTTTEGPQYRYRSWDTFTGIFQEQFWDPAIEEIHEKRMGELCMRNDPAHVYFWKVGKGGQVGELTRRRDWPRCASAHHPTSHSSQYSISITVNWPWPSK